MSKPNAKTLIVPENILTPTNILNACKLPNSCFKLYIYLCAHGTQELTSNDFCDKCSCSRKTFTTAFKELVTLGVINYNTELDVYTLKEVHI